MITFLVDQHENDSERAAEIGKEGTYPEAGPGKFPSRPPIRHRLKHHAKNKTNNRQ